MFVLLLSDCLIYPILATFFHANANPACIAIGKCNDIFWHIVTITILHGHGKHVLKDAIFKFGMRNKIYVTV